MTIVATPVAERLMLLSIRPRHVANILAGSKTVEIRRSRPSISAGQPTAIYSTVPDGAIVAVCTVDQVETGSPDFIWQRVGERTGLDVGEFASYFDGVEQAVALHLGNVTPLTSSVTLSHLRSKGGFHPPQTWHFLDSDQLEKLVGVHPARTELEDWRRGVTGR